MSLESETSKEPSQGVRKTAVYGSLLVVATAGLAYELVLGAAESLLLGDPVVQFALIVGLYMTALGVGAYVSGLIKSSVERRCTQVLLVTALVGGLAGPTLLLVFAWNGPFKVVLYGLTVTLGVLVGLQLPLMMRILKQTESFEDVVARAFAVDYVGALVGSLLFSLLLMPMVGMVRTTLLLGLLDALGALLLTWGTGQGQRKRFELGQSVAVGVLLLALVIAAGRVEALVEGAL